MSRQKTEETPLMQQHNAIKAKYPGSTIKEVGEILVVKDKKETRDHFEVVIETADKKEMELTVSLDGSKIE